MTLLPPIPASMRVEIETRLATLASKEGVRLLMAIESGSRAWGFPSPDSDFDIRFLYVRPQTDYLVLDKPRDVIERPIEDEIDLNGWDIRKALSLMLKHNAVVSEWIESPIRYVPDHPVVADLAVLASQQFNPRGYARHYANLGTGTVARWFEDGEDIPVKRYFYALRPALSIMALRKDPSRRPPMEMRALMAACDLAPHLVEQIEELIALKANTNEKSNAVRRPDIEHLVHAELMRAEDVPERLDPETFKQKANALFLRLVKET
ncbi:nucleotidyltransferase domain-containing protein [Erythrobacter sp. THAF29]|uniref:nucleotidyltransferase domain-containing protein n=1 Tax=Erythrobacter sp. THAF29 TaxID=2587851 RepID=UPI0012694C12|nr:nucleotidyltransferase domain-containing protein [Erythrobacter sp. THAF29]QFT78531.1 putative nucleotidyltransferase [Erythrobacter sp. THAF29]